ncbi:MAG: hypothetical protein WCH11_06980 [Bdellovibrio sp.]
MDCFGGMACGEANQESTSHRNFRYFWEQKSFNPITHEARFAIHFQRKHEAIRRNVFTYDWRMWSLPELREMLTEVGFASTSVFWEQSDPGSSKGNGVYRKTEKGETCEAWIAYVVGEK